jgi:hypothetical protein
MDADALQVEQAKVEEEQPVAVMEVERAPVDLKEIPPTNPKPAEKQMGVVPNTGDKLDSRTHAETEMGRQKVNTEKLTLPPTNVPKTGVDLPAENESEKQSKKTSRQSLHQTDSKGLKQMKKPVIPPTVDSTAIKATTVESLSPTGGSIQTESTPKDQCKVLQHVSETQVKQAKDDIQQHKENVSSTNTLGSRQVVMMST